MPASNWREVPTLEVEAVLRQWNGNVYPPTFGQLIAISERIGYRVCVVSPVFVPDAFSDLKKRVIWIPRRGPEEAQCCVLLHEVSEILLSLPVAPEYHYNSMEDEHHHIARLVERRASTFKRII